jgi:hypothetical protein
LKRERGRENEGEGERKYGREVRERENARLFCHGKRERRRVGDLFHSLVSDFLMVGSF